MPRPPERWSEQTAWCPPPEPENPETAEFRRKAEADIAEAQRKQAARAAAVAKLTEAAEIAMDLVPAPAAEVAPAKPLKPWTGRTPKERPAPVYFDAYRRHRAGATGFKTKREVAETLNHEHAGKVTKPFYREQIGRKFRDVEYYLRLDKGGSSC
jgi:hypothetical protein